MTWDVERLSEYAWLRPYLSVPADAAPPLYMTPPPADATGSYGPSAIAWIETVEKKTLRWWQRLAVVRQLEHDADGALVHRTIVETTPRRAGKSVRLRGVALWRMQFGEELFGEPQTIVHTGSDIAICREIQRFSWRWAISQGWKIIKTNGKECVETPDGARWLVRSGEGVYGYDTTLGIVDESWKVPPDVLSEGLEPSIMERLSPQITTTSTAHRRASSLMRTNLLTALTTDDPSVLLLWWGAPADADPSSPDTWKAASPHWSEDRRKMIASKYAKALKGEIDPQADDLDPLAGWASQYLNSWRLTDAVKAERGEPIVAAPAWGALAASSVPRGAPDAVGVESWHGLGVSVAAAWRTADGEAVTVSVSDHPTLAEAAAAVRASGFRGQVRVGKSLADAPEFKGLRVKAMAERTGAAVQRFTRLVSDGALDHDGGEHLTDQVLGVRTLPGPDGPRMVSTARCDALKAAVWAAEGCRKSVGVPRVLVARAV